MYQLSYIIGHELHIITTPNHSAAFTTWFQLRHLTCRLWKKQRGGTLQLIA